MSEEINHLSFQDSYHQNELPLENEYNPFRDTPNQLSTDRDYDTYYTRRNYYNYQQKPNPMNRPYEHTRQGHHLTSIDNNIIEEEKTHVIVMVSICDVIFVKVLYHMAQNCPEKHNLFYKQEVILFQSDFDHPGQIKNSASESWNAAVLDSGATNTVAGKEW